MRPFMPHGKCAAVEYDNERIRPISLIRIYDIQNLVFRLIRISQIQFNMSELSHVHLRLGSQKLFSVVKSCHYIPP